MAFKKKNSDPPIPSKACYPRDGETIAASTTLPLTDVNHVDRVPQKFQTPFDVRHDFCYPATPFPGAKE